MWMVRITGRWFEERSSIVLMECSNCMLDKNMSRFEGLQLGCL